MDDLPIDDETPVNQLGDELCDLFGDAWSKLRKVVHGFSNEQWVAFTNAVVPEEIVVAPELRHAADLFLAALQLQLLAIRHT
jgi:hypothetical protein